jgi:hypothetical protein
MKTLVRAPTPVSADRSAERAAEQLRASRTTAGHDGPGNQALMRLLADRVIKPKLNVSQPGDTEEVEADRIADAFVSRSVIHRKCASCEEEEEEKNGKVHRSALGPAGPPSAVGALSRSVGTTLPSSLRREYEPFFNADLSHVRVHTGADAQDAARALNAAAFTIRNDIFFGAGRFDTVATEGRRLMAHELSHAVKSSPVETPVVHRAPPDGDPQPPADGTKDLAEEERKALEAARGRVGQAAATVLFSNPNSPSTKDSPVTEAFTISEVWDRNTGDPLRHGFDSAGPATAYAAIKGPDGGAVLSQDRFYFAAAIKGKHTLRVTDPTIFEGDWWLGRDHVYRVTPSSGVVGVTGMGGFAFPLNKDLEDDPGRTRFIKDPQMAVPTDADSMRRVAGIGPDAGDVATKPKLGDEVEIPADKQEAFILTYFRARGLESLAANEKEAERLAETFKGTDPGSESRAPSGVSDDAKRIIAADRDQAKGYADLLDQEAHVEAILDFLKVCAERGEFPPFYPVYLKPQKDQVAALTASMNTRKADIVHRKNNILSLSPLIGQLVGMPDPKDRFDSTTVDRMSIPWTASIPKVRAGTDYKDSLLAQAATPENDEQIRAEFAKKLDAVRKAIRSARSEMLGDTDFLLDLEGLRALVKQDLTRATGKNAGLSATLDTMLKSHAIKEKTEEIGEVVIQVGLLFIPGGLFLSTMVGLALSAKSMSTHLKQWTISQASVNPAAALADQRQAEAALTRSSIELALNAVAAATEAINAIKTLESAAGEKKLKDAIEQMSTGEAKQAAAEVSAETSLAKSREIAAQEKSLVENQVRSPENIQNVLDETLAKEYDFQVSIGEHTYYHKPNGGWCRASGVAICGYSFGPEVESALDKARQARRPSKTGKETEKYVQDFLGAEFEGQMASFEGRDLPKGATKYGMSISDFTGKGGQRRVVVEAKNIDIEKNIASGFADLREQTGKYLSNVPKPVDSQFWLFLDIRGQKLPPGGLKQVVDAANAGTGNVFNHTYIITELGVVVY